MKKKGFLFVVLFLVQSCQYFQKNVPNKEDLLKIELKKINWTEVDEYPSTITCDSINDKNKRKQCFFDFMTAHLRLKLANDTIRAFYRNQDTLKIKVIVTPEATVVFQSQFKADSLPFNLPKADSVLQSKLINFPAVEPAIKRGVKVKSEFIIPVILKK